jgi:signal transduction histidine kinase/CheY-like chemotaxis protein
VPVLSSPQGPAPPPRHRSACQHLIDSHRPPPAPATPLGTGDDALAAAPPPADRIARQIDGERVAIVHRLTPIPVWAGMAFGLLVAVILWPYRPAAVVGGWLLMKLLVGALRIGDSRRFERVRRADGDGCMRHWGRRSLVLLVADGLVWGAMGVLFMPAEAPGIRAVMLAALIGVAGVGVFSYASDARGCVLFLLSLLLPTVAYQALQGSDEGWLACLGVVIYLAMMCHEARRSEERVVEMLRLRFENAWIAEQRQQAMRLSEHASAAKSRFLATVSHEMRTPLNGILGMTQLLQRSALDEAQRSQLEIIGHSARHLQAVIGDLLDLSRIEFGKLALDERPFVLAEVVHEVTGLLRAVAEDKGLGFVLELSPGLPETVRGDPSRIKQVLHNLLGNAIKFTAHGEVRLQVSRAGEALRFRVQDTGEGVAPQQVQRIFDAFEQGPAAAVPGRVGTGLGLTISRHLARAMGGDVACEPPPAPSPVEGTGRGAHFVFTMPCRPAPPAVAAGALPVPGPLPRLEGRVLVVDDNAVNALVACAMLKHLGLQVEVAEDGLAALQRMRAGHIDLVLMDCQLPALDGWEATRRWRRDETEGRLPIVALTANAVLGDRERCLAAGMDDYLAKPVEMAQLAAVVQRQLVTSEAG